jgi:hypothetical protein
MSPDNEPSASHTLQLLFHVITFLAPTWEQLAVNHQDWANTKDFKFAEVNCLLEGDLCYDNNVRSYPDMQL